MNGMSTVEKSMEKTKFYNREDLKAKDVVRLIGIWEGEAGESFTDYCDFSREADKNFLLFLAEKYPILYDYHCKVAGNDWPEVFRDDAGLDISIPGFITRGSWIRNNSPRTVTLDVTTYRGVSWNAVHYYGNIF